MKAIEPRHVARPLATALAAAAALTPTAALAANGEGDRAGAGERAPYEKRYLEVRRDFADEFGVREAGRNIVRDGYRERDGDVREARRGEVRRSIERMRAALAPAPEAETAPAAVEQTEAVSTAAAPTSVVQCESGGDYGAVNPAGYYGAYQFDQQTWDAYAPSGYAGTNPAEAPPAVQDAAAASVPYDAWPNC